MTVRWQDFGESERWKAAWGVWWRIAVVSIAFWIGLAFLIIVFALFFSSNEITGI